MSAGAPYFSLSAKFILQMSTFLVDQYYNCENLSKKFLLHYNNIQLLCLSRSEALLFYSEVSFAGYLSTFADVSRYRIKWISYCN